MHQISQLIFWSFIALQIFIGLLTSTKLAVEGKPKVDINYSSSSTDTTTTNLNSSSFSSLQLLQFNSNSSFVKSLIINGGGRKSEKGLNFLHDDQVQNDGPLNPLAQIGGDPCSSFSNSTTMHFSSPLYPHNYPNGTDCIKIISAGPGEVIRIKFLDHFILEGEETCQYDYLEVRDGQFGYSSLIQKICGSLPPSFIQSSGRHLWLRFHSDKDIQYIGFKALIEFFPSQIFRPELEECSETITTIDGDIESKLIKQDFITNARTYSIPVDCTWVIQAEENQKIYLQFSAYELEKPNDCAFNFIEVYGARTELEGPEGRIKQFCGSRSDSVTSKGNKIHVRFFTMSKDEVKTKAAFAAYFNVFRDAKEGNLCNPDTEFDCTDGTCLDLSLRCNEKENCKLRLDEDKEKCKEKVGLELSGDIVLIALIGLVLILGMCTGMFLNIYRKLMEDHEEMKELRDALKRSAEASTQRSSTNLEKNSIIKALNLNLPPLSLDNDNDDTDNKDKEKATSSKSSSSPSPPSHKPPPPPTTTTTTTKTPTTSTKIAEKVQEKPSKSADKDKDKDLFFDRPTPTDSAGPSPTVRRLTEPSPSTSAAISYSNYPIRPLFQYQNKFQKSPQPPSESPVSSTNATCSPNKPIRSNDCSSSGKKLIVVNADVIQPSESPKPVDKIDKKSPLLVKKSEEPVQKVPIPYSPPPPYISQNQSQSSSGGSKYYPQSRYTPIPPKPPEQQTSETQTSKLSLNSESDLNNKDKIDEQLLCVEVRDCATQTKESLFAPVVAPSHSTQSMPGIIPPTNTSMPSTAGRPPNGQFYGQTHSKAPLARGEAFEFDMIPRRILRKYSAADPNNILSKYPQPPASMSSATSTQDLLGLEEELAQVENAFKSRNSTRSNSVQFQEPIVTAAQEIIKAYDPKPEPEPQISHSNLKKQEIEKEPAKSESNKDKEQELSRLSEKSEETENDPVESKIEQESQNLDLETETESQQESQNVDKDIDQGQDKELETKLQDNSQVDQVPSAPEKSPSPQKEKEKKESSPSDSGDGSVEKLEEFQE